MSAPLVPVHGRSTDTRPGVTGEGTGSPGVYGKSSTSDGVLGEGAVGVYGRDVKSDGSGNGVIGYSQNNLGVWGHTETGSGVRGDSSSGSGVYGRSVSADGVLGEGAVGVYGRDLSGSSNGVIGYSQGGRGVWGHTDSGVGVLGESVRGHGLHGTSENDVAVWGESENFEGVHAVTRSSKTAGLAAYQANAASDSPALYAKHVGNRLAGLFEGSILVTGDISLQNADCAEDFDMASDGWIEPGTVMVLDAAGALRESYRPYDTAVAGVLSGAGDYRPGLVLDRHPAHGRRQALALVGKTFCKVDAGFGAIEVGTMLTTSSTPGFAMRVEHRSDAFGAVIGKALRPLREGLGLIPILIALQ